MKLSCLAAILALLLSNTAFAGSFSKVKTYSNDASFSHYNGLPAVYEINSSTGEFSAYSEAFTQLISIKLPLPNGYSLNNVLLADKFVSNDNTTYIAYIVNNSTGATQGVISDENGNMVKTFPDANSLWLVPAYSEYKLGVVRKTGGLSYTDLHDVSSTSFSLQHTFKTSSLGVGLPMGQRNGDISDLYYWHLDATTNEFMDYTHDFKLRSKASLSIPAGYTLSPEVVLLFKSAFNASTPYEIGVKYSNGSTNESAVFEADGTLLQTFSGGQDMIFYPKAFGVGNNALLMVQRADEKWDAYAIDNNKNDNNGSQIFTVPTRPKSNDGHRFSFYEPDSSQVKFFFLTTSSISISERIKLTLNVGEELLNYTVFFDGNGDADGQNQEVYAHIGNPSSTVGRFEIVKADGSKLLSATNVANYYHWPQFLSTEGTRIGLKTGNGALDIYDLDWSLTKVQRISPADDTKDLDNKDVVFRWKPQDNAVNYRFHLLDDTINLNVVFEEQTVNSSVTIPRIDSAKTYYWRVTAQNSNTSNFQGKFFTFTTKDPNQILPPTLLSPSNGATDVVKENLTVSWEAEENARFYEYQVSDDMSFSTFFSGVTSNTSGQPTNIKYKGTYYWRVKGFKGNYESDWSDVWSFTVAEESDIKTPTLQSPANNSNSIGLSPILLWGKDDNAMGYDIEYADNGSFSGATSESSIDNSITLTDLSHETRYFWRVKTKTADGNSDWSIAWAFTTIAEGQLASPTLLTPTNNQEGVDEKNAQLTWTEVDADNYTYEVSTDINFNQPITNNISEAKVTLSNLEDDKTYYWRVKANKGSSSSEWSSIGTFSTSNPDNVLEVANLKVEMYPNPANDVLNLHNSSNKHMIYTFFGTDGKKLFTGNIPIKATSVLNVEHLPTGVYELVISSASQTTSQLVLISR